MQAMLSHRQPWDSQLRAALPEAILESALQNAAPTSRSHAPRATCDPGPSQNGPHSTPYKDRTELKTTWPACGAQKQFSVNAHFLSSQQGLANQRPGRLLREPAGSGHVLRGSEWTRQGPCWRQDQEKLHMREDMREKEAESREGAGENRLMK